MSDLIVTTDIPIGDPGRGAYVYRVGQRVPESEVIANKWEAYVAKPTTKEAKAARQQAGAETQES